MIMEIETGNIEKASIFMRGLLWLKGISSKSLDKIYEISRRAVEIGKEDPRRLIHSLKVGLTITLVSFFYYFQPLYSSFGVSAMWAVMTVVVVFEFSVGATLGKGLNRGMATLAASALGLGAHHLAGLTGKTSEPILIGLFVFLQAVASTFIRFIPKVKARYDYGMLIFILTFCLVSISGYRTDEILKLAQKRLSTIFIGASTCVIAAIFICPVWAGEDLQNLVASNVEILGSFLEGFADECFGTAGAAAQNQRAPVSLNSVLDSKCNEETLANFARWEPGHGKFMYRHPWKQYLNIANLTRQCACRVQALNGYIISKTQAPQEIQGIIQEAFSSMSSESGKALKELSLAIKTMTQPSSSKSHIANLKTASKNLKSLLKSDSWEEYNNLLQVIPVAAIASLLIDTAVCVENIGDAVDELSSSANFKCCKENNEGDSDKENNKKDLNFEKVELVSVTIDGGDVARVEGQSSIEVNRQILKM